MIKDIILNVSRSYNPYVPVSEIWGAGQSFSGELDNEYNGRKFIRFDSGSDWSVITVANNNTFGVKNNGTIWAWGNNSSGDLGLGDTITRSSPVQIGTLSTWISASNFGGGAVALKNDGTLWGWGLNTSGQLGLDDLINRSSPVQIGTRIWKDIFGSGAGYTIALGSDDTIWGWGTTQNQQGVFGNGQFNSGFGIVDYTEGPWSIIRAGASFTVAVKSDGRLYAWGVNTQGQLGLGDVVVRSSPVQIGTLSSWVSASISETGAGTNATIAIQNNGTLWAWGSNNNGQLGLGNLINRSSPVQIGTHTNWLNAEIGQQHSLAVKSDGTLWGWGSNGNSQLAISNYTVKQIDNLTTWVSASVTYQNIVALKTDGTMWTWGTNSLGQLGLGDTITRSSPVQVGTLTWTKAVVGGNSAAAIRSDGTLWTWGSNNPGQLGINLGLTANRSSPVQVGTLTWIDVIAGPSHTMAVRSDNTLWAWGLNSTRELADGTNINRSSPVQIGTLANWSNVLMPAGRPTGVNVIALKTDGTIWSWGQNGDGQLGLDDSITRSSPVQIGTRNDWSQISISAVNGAALRNDGTLWIWGRNGVSYQLGDGTTISRSSPVQLGTRTDWYKVLLSRSDPNTNSGNHFAIRNDRTLWGWGNTAIINDLSGNLSSPVQLGTNSNWEFISPGGSGFTSLLINTSNEMYGGPGSTQYTLWSTIGGVSSPIQIGTDTNWAKAGLANQQSYAIKTDGTLWGWGQSFAGFPYINETYSVVASPKQIGTDTWYSLSFGGGLIGLKTDNTLWAWGPNSFGNLGLGDTITRSSPVQVGTLTWNEVSHNFSHTMAIRSDNTLWSWGDNFNGRLTLGDNISRSSPVQVGNNDWISVSTGLTHNVGIRATWNNDLYTGGVAISDPTNAIHNMINGWGSIRRSPILLSQSNPWSKLHIGLNAVFGVKPDGTLWAWGQNSGILGLNDTVARYSPVQVGTDTNWSRVNYQATSTFGIKTNGTLWGWGGNSQGQLGIGDSITRSSPVQVGTLTWIDIKTTSNATTHGIRSDGTLWAWGLNQQGQFGINTTITPVNSPVQVGTETDWLKFSYPQARSTNVTFAFKQDNSLYVVNGSDTYLLESGFEFQPKSPVQVTSQRTWKSVATGTGFTIAINQTGSIWAWGKTTDGVMGQGTVITGQIQESPVQIGTLTWASASAGETNVAAIRNDNTIWTWGSNGAGQLGLRDLINRSSPVQVGTLNNWLKVAAGRSHVMSIKTDGTMWGWGLGTTNQIGDGQNTTRSSPVQIGTRTDWNKVSAGDGHTMGITNSGNLFAWGFNGTGQLGINNVATIGNPFQVGINTWIDVSAGQQMTVAVRSDGTLWSWGLNTFGRLGIFRNRNLPNYVVRPPLFTNTKAYWQSAFGRSTNGTLWAWGGNSTGQLGLSDTITRSSPVQIGTLTWSDISPGTFHTNAIRNGQLWVWGSNNEAQLGLMQYDVQYLSGSNLWTDVQVGGNGSFIFEKNDGTLWGVGSNSLGELGLDNTTKINSPVQIGTRTWNSYSVGNQTTLAIRNDGTLWGWGRNTSAELGLDINRNVPQYVNITQTWQNAKTGNQGNVIVHSTDGSLWGWGTNSSGQLGLNDTVNRSSPVQIGTETNWQTYHVGDAHVIAVKTDGTLWSWGQDGGGGALGLNATINRSSPVQVGTLNNWSQVTAGSYSSYSIKTDGTLWAWGTNNSGQIGDNTQVSRSSPVQIGTRNDWKQLAKSSAGVSHMMAISNDNTLWYWGSGTNGKLGNNLSTNRSSPVQLGTETNWAVVSLSIDNTYAIKTDGTLWSWGLNNLGQLGLNLATTAHRSSPVQVGTLNTWLDVSAGYSFTMAIRNDGTLWSWGVNTSGQLGDGTLINRSSPVQIGTLNTWVSASGGNNNAVLLQNNGYALTTGNSVHPGYDTGFLLNRSSPVQIGTQSNWSYVSVGAHSAAVRTDGTLWTWGLNTSGQLGIGVATNRSSAVQVGTDTNWATAYTIGAKTYAIKTNGTLWAWGRNDFGELGQNNFGATTYRSSPVQIGTLTWSNVARGTASDAFHVVAVRTDGTLWSWGSGNSGRLGLNNDISRSSPVQVGTRSDWVSATIGASNTMAVRYDGTLWSWGANTSNQVLGQNDNINRSSPVQVGTLSTWVSASLDGNYSVLLQNNGDAYTTALYNNDFSLFGITRSSPVQLGTLSNWAQVDGGYQYSLAIKQDGTLWGWGSNLLGALGDGTTTNRSSPVQIGTDTNWSRVFAGYFNNHALKTDGTLWAWGYNGPSGVLGINNTITGISSPVQVGTRTWLSVADKAGYQLGNDVHVLAVRSDGTLWAWGSNFNGALGLNLATTTLRSSPVQIGTETNWISAAVGDNTSMAIRSNGTLWAWGTNTDAQLGLGDTVNRSSPVQVGTLSNWVSASFGQANSVLLQNNGYGLTTGIYAHGYDILPYTINRSSPSQIGADTDWQRVYAGYSNFTSTGNQVIAQKTDGTLWTWGSNNAGNLADGTIITRSSPVQIGNETTWVDFSAQLHFVGIKQY